VLNAANEVAVEAFLDRRIAYLAIADVVRSTLNQVQDFAVPDLETVNAADSLARQAAGKAVALMELRAA
jgi:1-deoxy-D-xylulose-5-phosphate reductoisomerase